MVQKKRILGSVCFVLLLGSIQCMSQIKQYDIEQVHDLEYGYDKSAALDEKIEKWMDTPIDNSFLLTLGCDSDSSNSKPLMSFVHVSDLQLRDYALQFFGNVLKMNGAFRKGVDRISNGTMRPASLEQNDEIPYLSLISALNKHPWNETTTKPKFVIHTGDAVDSGTTGELVTFVALSNLLEYPWFSVIGNHDVLLFGNLTFDGLTVNKPSIGLLPIKNRGTFVGLHGKHALNPSFKANWEHKPTQQMTPENSYRHGFDRTSRGVKPDRDRASNALGQYSILVNERPNVRLIVIDTVPSHREIESLSLIDLVNGRGAEGYFDNERFQWLESELSKAKNAKELVLVAGHHPISKQDKNGLPVPTISARYMGDPFSILQMLKKYDNILAYLGGHTHSPRIKEHKSENHGTFLEIIAPSLHDYPQQGYYVQLLEDISTRKLGVQVKPVQGVPTKGPLKRRFKAACQGALSEKFKNGDHKNRICFENNPCTNSIYRVRANWKPMANNRNDSWGEYAVFLDGEGDFVQMPDGSQWNIPVGATTIEMWMRRNDRRTARIFSKGSFFWSKGYMIDTHGDVIMAEISPGEVNKTGVRCTSKTKIGVDVWNHVAVVFDTIDGYIKMYINGHLDNECNMSRLKGNFFSNNEKATIGIYNGDLRRSPFHGYLDEVRVWGTERSEKDIKRNMHSLLTGKEDGLHGYWPMESEEIENDRGESDRLLGGDAKIVPIPVPRRLGRTK